MYNFANKTFKSLSRWAIASSNLNIFLKVHGNENVLEKVSISLIVGQSPRLAELIFKLLISK